MLLCIPSFAAHIGVVGHALERRHHAALEAYLHAVPVLHIPKTSTFMGTVLSQCLRSICLLGENISGKRSSRVCFGLLILLLSGMRAPSVRTVCWVAMTGELCVV